MSCDIFLLLQILDFSPICGFTIYEVSSSGQGQQGLLKPDGARDTHRNVRVCAVILSPDPAKTFPCGTLNHSLLFLVFWWQVQICVQVSSSTSNSKLFLKSMLQFSTVVESTYHHGLFRRQQAVIYVFLCTYQCQAREGGGGSGIGWGF